MPLKTFKTKDDVPEALRAGAIETKDGQFAIAEDEDTSELKDALTEERTKREAAEKLTKKAAGDLKKLEQKLKAGESGLTDEQIEKVRAELRAEIDEEVATVKTEAENAKAELRTLKLTNVVKGFAAEAGFLGEKLDDFWKLHGDEFDLTDDGKPTVKGKPGSDVKKHVAGIAQKRKEWVEGTRAGGGGAGGGGGGKGEESPSGSPEQRLAAAHAAGSRE